MSTTPTESNDAGNSLAVAPASPSPSATSPEGEATQHVAHTHGDAPAAAASGGGAAIEGASAEGASAESASAESASAEGASDEDGAEEGDEEGGEGETAAADGAAPAAGADGEKKKRKRRRRKKKGANAQGAPGEVGPNGEAVEGVTAEGGSAGQQGQGQGQGRHREHREKKEPRERPAFNLGDVVFGKVIEVLEDALIVDLSGKAKAVFDLRELLIPDDEDHGPPDEDEQQEAAEAAAGSADATPADGVDAAPTPIDGATVPDASASATSEGTAAGTEVAPTAEAVEVKPVDPGPKPDFAEHAAARAAEPSPTLPRVILEPGAPFVGVVHNDGGRGGLVVLTHHPKRVRKAKPLVSAALRDHTMVWGLVTGVIKGGVEVDVEGLRAFAPGSHMDMRPGADLSPFIGKRLGFAVTQYGKRGRDVVLTRRSIIEAEAKASREEALSKVAIGAVTEGTVRSVVAFGAFIDIGGVEGLVPLAEMSHNRADGPKDVFTVGEKVQVKVQRVDERGKLWLSRKATLEDPWAEVAKKFAVGTKHMAKVARLQPFGAFMELEAGVDGLIHAADLSFKRFEKIEDVCKVGDEMEVVVANIDSGKKKIGLHPALTGDAANEAPQKIGVHKSVKVRIISADTSGVVVRVLGVTGRSARGFIPPGGTGTPRGTDLRKLFPPNKELEVRIIDIDPRRGEPKLSIRAHNEETEKAAYNAYRAQVKREAKFGTFADLLQKTLKKES